MLLRCIVSFTAVNAAVAALISAPVKLKMRRFESTAQLWVDAEWLLKNLREQKKELKEIPLKGPQIKSNYKDSFYFGYFVFAVVLGRIPYHRRVYA